MFCGHSKEHGKHGATRLLDGTACCDSLRKTLQCFFHPVFHSYGEGLVEALRPSNEGMKLQLAPQSGRTQVAVFSCILHACSVQEHPPKRSNYIHFSSGLSYTVIIYILWYLLGLGVTLLICSEVRKLGWRPAKSVGQKPGTTRDSNEIRKSKMWANAKKSMDWSGADIEVRFRKVHEGSCAKLRGGSGGFRRKKTQKKCQTVGDSAWAYFVGLFLRHVLLMQALRLAFFCYCMLLLFILFWIVICYTRINVQSMVCRLQTSRCETHVDQLCQIMPAIGAGVRKGKEEEPDVKFTQPLSPKPVLGLSNDVRQNL